MIELKPCPFCGGNPELEEADIKGFWRIRCENADCVAGASWCNSYDREKLANAWNTRAERTCRNLSDDDNWFCCSACGAETRGFMVDDFAMAVEIGKAASRCPNCGAKVVKQ